VETFDMGVGRHSFRFNAELGATSASAELGATRSDGLGGTKTSINSAADTKTLETTAKEGMSLIDRFYNGGNRARPAALDILVVVLDGVVRRMRQQYASRQTHISEGNAQIARLDASINSIQPKQAKLQAELEEKKARAAELREAVAMGEGVINDSVEVAKAALEKASLLQRSTEKAFIAGVKLSNNGYDGKGRPLQGRELNLRKRGTVAARKPGDLLPGKTDDEGILARAKAVLNGEALPPSK